MKLTKSQMDALLKESETLHSASSHLRKGQCFFICLHKNYPEISKYVNGKIFDPFNVDEKINDCINALTKK